MIVATLPAASVCLTRFGRIFTSVSSLVVRVVILTPYRTMAGDDRCAGGSDSRTPDRRPAPVRTQGGELLRRRRGRHAAGSPAALLRRRRGPGGALARDA